MSAASGRPPDAGAAFPELTICDDGDRPERLARLLRAHDVVGSLVRILWPADRVSRDSLAVRWAGAVPSLVEEGDQLTVTWADGRWCT